MSLAIDLLILFVVVLYFSLIYWTYVDARRRILDPMLVGCATAVSLFPFVGAIIYVILRPPEYLEDVRERELEVQAAEARLHELGQTLCPHCDYRIERDFVRCPSCLRKLKERCVSCQRPLDQAWTICPYCETEVPGAIAPTRRQRRRRSVATEEDRSAEPLAEPMVGQQSIGDEPAAIAAPAVAPAVGPARAIDEAAPRTEPVVTPEPASSRSRGAGRARRPRPTS